MQKDETKGSGTLDLIVYTSLMLKNGKDIYLYRKYSYCRKEGWSFGVRGRISLSFEKWAWSYESRNLTNETMIWLCFDEKYLPHLTFEEIKQKRNSTNEIFEIIFASFFGGTPVSRPVVTVYL